MIAKIKLPIPIHLFDHLIIPINVRESHWLPAHLNLQTRCISLLEQVTPTVRPPIHNKKCFFGFFQMVWTAHASTDAPVPSWVVRPARFTTLHPKMTAITPGMIQTLGQYRGR